MLEINLNKKGKNDELKYYIIINGLQPYSNSSKISLSYFKKTSSSPLSISLKFSSSRTPKIPSVGSRRMQNHRKSPWRTSRPPGHDVTFTVRNSDILLTGFPDFNYGKRINKIESELEQNLLFIWEFKENLCYIEIIKIKHNNNN